jgi:hypothetical protein
VLEEFLDILDDKIELIKKNSPKVRSAKANSS